MTWLTIWARLCWSPTLWPPRWPSALEGASLTWFLYVILFSTVASTILAWWWWRRRIYLPTKADEFVPMKEPRKRGH
jgi:hypothetical protein